MNDKQLEELLRASWQPEPPEDMRDKTLARAHQQIHRRRFSFTFMLGWKPALAALGIAIVIFTNVSEAQREERLSAMIEGQFAGSQTRIASGCSVEDLQRRQLELIAQLSADMEDRKPL